MNIIVNFRIISLFYYLKRVQYTTFDIIEMMGRRSLIVDWKSFEGARVARRKLYLRPNEDGLFLCPAYQCLHSGFKSKRGCRKHIDTKHEWYFYFDTIPEVKNEVMMEARKNLSPTTHSKRQPSYSTDIGVGREFKDWLITPCGGGKNMREATQSSKRAMKFLMHCTGCTEVIDEIDDKFLDCCLGSVSMIVSFLKTIQDEWKMGHTGALNYLKSIGDLMDFRKSAGVSDVLLRSFSITEVYIRRGKQCLRKRNKADCSRNFDLETLIAKNSWATVEEMEQVVPFHLPRFQSVITKCKDIPSGQVSISDLTFATRFVTTFLFLNVKCTRPMTFQRLTIQMLEKAKSENGYIDQKEFKTADTYMFDTLIFSADAMTLVSLYVQHVRPLLNPICEYVLINNNGKMCANLCNAMTITVFEAIGKYINPTRYRQIIETASSEKLTMEEQSIISKDQKHNSHVAEVYYKKQISRDIATKGKACMEKLVGEQRGLTNSALATVISDIKNTENTFGIPLLSTKESIIDVEEPMIINDQQEIKKSTDADCYISNTDQIKEEIPDETTQRRQLFTEAENEKLKDGIVKFGRGQWSRILNFGAGTFSKSRNRDSLRMRANTIGFKRTYEC